MVRQEKTGGALLMDCLISLGACKGFGVPGESYLAVLAYVIRFISRACVMK